MSEKKFLHPATCLDIKPGMRFVMSEEDFKVVGVVKEGDICPDGKPFKGKNRGNLLWIKTDAMEKPILACFDMEEPWKTGIQFYQP